MRRARAGDPAREARAEAAAQAGWRGRVGGAQGGCGQALGHGHGGYWAKEGVQERSVQEAETGGRGDANRGLQVQRGVHERGA